MNVDDLRQVGGHLFPTDIISWRGRSRTHILSVNSRAHCLSLRLCYTPMKLPGLGSNQRPRAYHGPVLSVKLPGKKERKLSRIKQNGEPLLSWWGVRVTIPAGQSRLIYSQARLLSGLPPQRKLSSFLGDLGGFYCLSTQLLRKLGATRLRLTYRYSQRHTATA